MNRAYFNGLKAVAAARDESIFINGRFVLLVDSSIQGIGTVTGTNEFEITGAQVSTGITFPVTFSPESDPFNRTDVTVEVSNPIITFPSAGRYYVQIGHPFRRIFFNASGDRNKLFKILQWGSQIFWNGFNQNFRLCNNLGKLPDGHIPNTQNISSLFLSFSRCNIDAIPQGMLDLMTNLTNMNTCFELNPISNTPKGLFINNTQINNFNNCFVGVTLNVDFLSRLYIELEATNTQNNVNFNGGNGQYDPDFTIPEFPTFNAGQARAALVARGWNLTDGGAI